MDPIAHTLVGASLAATGLARRSRVGTATLVVAANLPDVDAITYALGADTSLLLRRGWTHGIVAMCVLPLLVAAAWLLLERWRRPRDRPLPPRRLLPILLLTGAVWSHSALDLLNTYGVRLLMPFDGRWFYGDTLFIVDPWFWLLAGLGAVITFRKGWWLRVGWIALGLLGTTLVVLAPGVSTAMVLAWLVAVAAVAGASVWPSVQRHGSRAAGAGLAMLAIYIGLMRVGSLAAREQARTWLAARQVVPVALMAGPVPVDPWRRDVIVQLPDRYEFLVVDLPRGTVVPGGPPLPRGEQAPAVDAALASPAVMGFREWKRYPSYAIVDDSQGLRVLMRDVRYAREGDRGFAVAEVLLPRR